MVDPVGDGGLNPARSDAVPESTGGREGGQRETVGLDRRSLRDRRQAYDLNYFDGDGVENRKRHERRRRRVEPRKGWDRISDWTSAMIRSRAQPAFNVVYSLEEAD